MEKNSLLTVTIGFLFCTVILTACGGGGGGGGGSKIVAPTYDGGASVAAKTTVIMPGDIDCPNGGVLVETGIDVSGNGLLDDDEVSNFEKICSGAATLINLTEEGAGFNCANGGIKIDVGLDASGEGTLDVDEITATDYICNGEILVGGAPQTTVNPVDASAITHLGEITINFSEPMNSTTLLLGGDMGPESDGGEWTSFYTLKLSPSTLAGWIAGTARTLTVDAEDLNGNPITQLSLSYDVERILYVSVDHGNASNINPGTQDAPKASIPSAIAVYNLYSTTGEIRVAAGLYRNELTGQVVELFDGLKLYGGYSPVDWSLRDPEEYKSIITNANGGGTAIEPRCTVCAGFGISTSTIVDGFEIYGASGSYSSSIFAQAGAALIIQNNTIYGGQGSTVSYGIINVSSSPIIQNNIINGGSGASSFAISNYSGSSALIQNNTIDGGSGATWSRGIYTKDSSPTIQNNTINGGSGGVSHGIYNYNDSPTIENNIIDGGKGVNTSVGIVSTTSSALSYLATPIIQNNVIRGGSGGNSSEGIDLYETSPVIQSNIIDGGTGGLYSHGILSDFSIPVIRNNTINGGSGGDETTGITLFANYSAASLFTIENNIVFTADTASVANHCINEGNVSLLLRNNDLLSCSTALYVNYVGTGGNCSGDTTRDCLTAIADVNSLSDTTASDNVSVDPLFEDIDGTDNDITTMDDNDWHLTFSSPTSVTTGGLDGGPLGEDFGFTTDKDGTTRTGNNTTGWSMGAYEYD